MYIYGAFVVMSSKGLTDAVPQSLLENKIAPHSLPLYILGRRVESILWTIDYFETKYHSLGTLSLPSLFVNMS